MLSWLLLQLFALLLPALRIPLTAGYPSPAEFQALRMMLAFQIAVSAILFPELCRTGAMYIASAASGCFMLLVAAALAGRELSHVAVPAAYLSLWLAGLALWRAALPKVWRIRGSSIITVLTLGGALLWYFKLDFNAGTPAAAWAFGPLLNAAIEPDHPPLAAWLYSAGSVLLVLVALALRRLFQHPIVRGISL